MRAGPAWHEAARMLVRELREAVGSSGDGRAWQPSEVRVRADDEASSFGIRLRAEQADDFVLVQMLLDVEEGANIGGRDQRVVFGIDEQVVVVGALPEQLPVRVGAGANVLVFSRFGNARHLCGRQWVRT